MEANGEGRKIRLITEAGAFGKPGHMLIVRRWPSLKEKARAKQLQVQSFVVLGEPEKALATIEETKAKLVQDPLFVSLTILEFVSETRLIEPEQQKGKIIIPDSQYVRCFGKGNG